MWTDALILPGTHDLEGSLQKEIEQGKTLDPGEIRRRWTLNENEVAKEWRTRVADPADKESVETFYDQSQGYIFELMRWHALIDDDGPLAYAVALQFAQERSCKMYLDFGAGVGSGAILFARHGFDVTLADISSTLTTFARARLAARHLQARLLDLRHESLPSNQYDIVTAMDVWEHLTDPVRAATQVARAIRPGGFLFGRFAAEPDPELPQHIVFDFEPTFRQLENEGMKAVWRDEWLWGHQAFQKQ